ncbi:MAG: hypothetical protein J7L34_02030, partial [Thermotogaceae bacterium]|nr:hypothetical protein [Thermotogaceae bacterium]
MRVRIFALSGALALVTSFLVFFVYVAMLGEMSQYIGALTSDLVKRSVKVIGSSVEKFLSDDPWISMINNGEYEKVAKKLMENEWISGVKIEDYSTPTT